MSHHIRTFEGNDLEKSGNEVFLKHSHFKRSKKADHTEDYTTYVVMPNYFLF